jgi:hypothetical protein
MRNVSLNLYNKNGWTNGSNIVFMCKESFNLIGKDRVYCENGIWDYTVPQCVLTNNICQLQPKQTQTGNNNDNGDDSSSFLVSLIYKKIKNELNFLSNKIINSYLVGKYACNLGRNFTNEDSRQIGTIMVNTSNGSMIQLYYKNVTCVGRNLWQNIPKCI